MDMAIRKQELYLEGMFKAEIVKNRPVDAGCRRYMVFKRVYLPKSLQPLKTDVTEGSCV